LAEGLAKELGYEMVSREDVVREAAAFGANEESLQKALLNPPSFWERFKHERRCHLAFVQAALCEHAQKDRIVYHGNAGHLLLQGVSHVLCIRIVAPMPVRIQMLMERRGMGRDEAIDFIEKVDRERQAWTRFLYDVDWLDPSLYDLTINLRTLDVARAVEIAAAAARNRAFEPTEESREAMAGLVLASRVRAALAANSETCPADVEVDAKEGVVYLKGKLHQATMVDAVINVASAVAGVQQVNREDLAAPDYSV
jgi:cytidylate kinase